MIETAIEVTDERVPAAVIAELMEAGREMLRYPIELLPHAREAVEMAAQTHRVILIAKGDLIDQERKLAQSGLGELFNAVEISSICPGLSIILVDANASRSLMCLIKFSLSFDLRFQISWSGTVLILSHIFRSSCLEKQSLPKFFS